MRNEHKIKGLPNLISFDIKDWFNVKSVQLDIFIWEDDKIKIFLLELYLLIIFTFSYFRRQI
jgi:hypothetical protein